MERYAEALRQIEATTEELIEAARELETCCRTLAESLEQDLTPTEDEPAIAANEAVQSIEGNESPPVYGCPACLRMFSTDTFYQVQEGYKFCIGCGEPGLEYLGVLPLVMEQDSKFHLIGDEEGVVTGPYDTQEAAQSDVWGWFAARDNQDEDTPKSQQKGHLRLAALEGIVLEKKDDRQ